MSPPWSSRLAGFGILLLVIVLPLVGAALAGHPLGAYFRFPPPLALPSDYLRFSWLAAGAVSMVLGIIAASWIAGAKRVGTHSQRHKTAERNPESFPWWGGWALAWILVCWVLAWTRWPWFEVFQRFTFFPLWIGFIVGVNALTQRRTGTCLMRRAPSRWFALFGYSALFWWVFEWLNRFVRNWHYLGVEEFGAFSYALHASVCFSTVLPAVAAVTEWLESHSGWRSRTEAGPAWRWLARPGFAAGLFAAGAGALVLTGAFPRWFYPALWVAPLALLLSEPVLARRRGLAQEIAGGVWVRAASWMMAALICGFFWELWNWHSLAKWSYTVPGVERWRVFEMPLLGYTGYLPFGLECLLVFERVLGSERLDPSPRFDQSRAG